MSVQMVFHSAENRVSVGAEVHDNGMVIVSYALCNPLDQFTRQRGYEIVTARLEVGSKSNLILGEYQGDRPHRDVFAPIRDAVRGLKKGRTARVEQLQNALARVEFRSLVEV